MNSATSMVLYIKIAMTATEIEKLAGTLVKPTAFHVVQIVAIIVQRQNRDVRLIQGQRRLRRGYLHL
jgi:hypothetical protein